MRFSFFLFALLPFFHHKCMQGSSVNVGITKFPEVADSNFELDAKILGDHDFTLAHLMAAWALSHHALVYAYVFSDGTHPRRDFAGHGSDQAFFFGTAGLAYPDDPGPGQLSSLIMGAWASFARHGDPSTPELGSWPPVSFPKCANSKLALPESTAAWAHMHFEHNRVGMTNFGCEEVLMWFRAAGKLCSIMRRSCGSGKLRNAVKDMASALNIELTEDALQSTS
jgi:hypothetical protein